MVTHQAGNANLNEIKSLVPGANTNYEYNSIVYYSCKSAQQ